MMEILSDGELLRYNRQIILRDFDIDKQERLKQASVLIVGAGGLGCSASQYLAAAGVGHLTLIDFDHVSLSNLQRQVLHNDSRLNMAKVESAAISLQALNPHLKLQIHNCSVDDEQFSHLIPHHQLVLDCTDNIAARNQLNRLCYQHKIPLISGAAIRMEGQITVFNYQPEQPCYHCLSQFIGEQNLSCVETGVMSPLVGIIGSLQAMEAIKVITDYGRPLIGRLLLLDAMSMQFREFKFSKNPQCKVCS